MKKNIILFLGLSVMLATAGCSDFLSQDNKSDVVAGNYYKSRQGYKKLMSSTYAQLRTLYGQSDDVWMYCAGTDMFWQGRDPSNAQRFLSSYENLTPLNSIVTQYYQDSYHAIQVANTAIYFNSKTESSPQLQNRLGEAKFLRALFYFNLIRQFGGVALVENRINNPVFNFHRTPADSVYTFIINQMKQSLNLVLADNDPGRVDKETVQFYLSLAYLTRGYKDFGSNSDFSQAAKYADKAINNQPLTISFKKQWYPGNDQNAGVIFSVQYNKASIQDPAEDGSIQNYFFSPYLGGEGQAVGYPYRSHSLVPDKYVFNLFSQYDSRLGATFMLKYYKPYYAFYNQHGALNSLDVKYYYVPKWAESDTTAWRAAAPSHRDSTVIVPFESWTSSAVRQYYHGLYGLTSPPEPPVKKFDDPTSVFSNSGSSTRDIILAHLSEAYLIAAEAYFQMGNLSKAAARINEVKRRAAKPGHENDMLIQPGDVTLNLILNERARELLGEYSRWYTLTRTGTLMKRDRKYNRNVQKWFHQGINPFKGNGGNFKLLRPIPQEAIDLNHSEVQQNPAYK
jgi:hypothetical protein